MGLFSSKSSSKQYTTNYNTMTSGTFGDLSHDNTLIGGDYSYNPVGLAGEELSNVLGFAYSTQTESNKLVSDTLDKSYKKDEKTFDFVNDVLKTGFTQSQYAMDSINKANQASLGVVSNFTSTNANESLQTLNSIKPIIVLGIMAIAGAIIIPKVVGVRG